MLAAALCAIALILVVAYIVLNRRSDPAPDPMRWREERAEPWGSIVLGTWLAGSAVIGIASALNQRWVQPPVVAGMAVGLPWMLIAASRQVRQLAIIETEIEWRTLTKRWSTPVSEVVGVSGPHRSPPRICLADGRSIHLPEDPGVRAVTRTLADGFGVSELPPDLEAWDCDASPEAFERMAPRVREVEARAVVRRRDRKHFGLRKEAAVHVVGTGPPYVSLERRAELLERCRDALSAHGLAITSARWIEGDAAFVDGIAAQSAAMEDERCADTDGHWWMHDLVWQDESGDTTVFAPGDFDQIDLVFIGWGSRAEDALRTIESAVASRH